MTASALTPSRSTCVACVPVGGGGTRRSRNASCRRSASRVVAGPILRLTNQRSPRRTSSARRLIAAPLYSVRYRQEAQCHDCCPRSSSHVSPTSVFPNSSCSFVATSLNLARIVDAGRQRGNTLRCESITQSPCLAPKSLRNCPPRSVRFLIGSTALKYDYCPLHSCGRHHGCREPLFRLAKQRFSQISGGRILRIIGHFVLSLPRRCFGTSVGHRFCRNTS